jgi:hypothetical protein
MQESFIQLQPYFPIKGDTFMKMQVTLGNPFLIFVYSLSLLLMGDAVGIFWRAEPITAFSIAPLGAAFMVVHDTLSTLIWIWVTARWMQSANIRRPNKSTTQRSRSEQA